MRILRKRRKQSNHKLHWGGYANPESIESGSRCLPDGVKCLNPWDCQSKRQYRTDGAYRTLDAGQCKGGQSHGICYPAAFMGGQGAKARGIAYCNDGSTPTLKSAPSGGNTVPDVVFCLQGNGIDRCDSAGCNGNGFRSGESYTLNTIDRHAVCFQQNQRDEVRDMGEQAGALTAESGMHNQNYLCYPEKARSLCARHDSSPCHDRGQNIVCYGVDCRNGKIDAEKTHTIQAKSGGGQSLNYTPCMLCMTAGETATGERCKPLQGITRTE